MYKKLVFQFIPIIIIFLFLSYPKISIFWSNTILGKIISLLIILFYSKIDVSYGLMVCLIIIIYYQSLNHYAEGMEGIDNNVRTQFEKKNCVNGSLKYKTMDVKTEMSQHIFPEISFENEKCNPCDTNCDYKIIEEKLINEEELQEHKSSKEWVWSKLSSITQNLQNPIIPPKESIGVKTEPFSFL